MATTESFPIPTPKDLARISGVHNITSVEIAAVAPELDPRVIRRQDIIAQAHEVFLVNYAADSIEQSFVYKGLPLPNMFVLYTGGMKAPEESKFLGTLADVEKKDHEPAGPFRLFMPADIGGHAGVGMGVRLSENASALYMHGRAHPYAAGGKQYAEFLYARMLNTFKELIRRQRRRGIQSGIVLTYLMGSDEDSILKPGDLAIVIDHSERAAGRAALSAGSGPRDVLDVIGERFQPKMQRGSDPLLANVFMQMAAARGITVGPAVAIGTQDTTSFQGYLNIAEARNAFEKAQEIGLRTYAESIYGPNTNISLMYDMALAFEVDVLRQIHIRQNQTTDESFREADIPLLILGLPTDSVGQKSIDTDHHTVIQQALARAAVNGELISTFVSQASETLNDTHPLQLVPSWAQPLTISPELLNPYAF